MRYGKIKYFDAANGSGVRTSLFVSGCYRHCPGCFSPETWDFEYGQEFTEKTEKEILESLKPDYISGLSVIGGEPLENRQALIPFLRKVKNVYPNKTIWLFTGYDWTELRGIASVDSSVTDLLNLVDVLKAGDFVEDQKQVGLLFKGSKNQELIDMNKTRAAKKKVLWRVNLDE